VKGGLEVDGACVLSNVTVKGGVTVDAGAGLGFLGGAIKGGITINSGGEFDLNAVLGIGSPTNTSSTIDGGVTLNRPKDFDLWNTTINGGVNVANMTTGFFQPAACGNTINGGYSQSNSSLFTTVGDPEGLAEGSAFCPGNTIQGGVNVTNQTVNKIELEGNTITGSVALDGSIVEIAGNSITGRINCSNGTTLVATAPPDPPSQACN
jgi:hypothetical protein